MCWSRECYQPNKNHRMLPSYSRYITANLHFNALPVFVNLQLGLVSGSIRTVRRNARTVDEDYVNRNKCQVDYQNEAAMCYLGGYIRSNGLDQSCSCIIVDYLTDNTRLTRFENRNAKVCERRMDG